VVSLVTVLSVARLPVDAAEGQTIYRMVFPLLGEHTLTDSFGDPRGRGRKHAGVDILADRMTPVVAVADGTVQWIHNVRGDDCCDVALEHDDGWRSRYIHLNNDTPGTDDGRAVGIAPGLRKGSRLAAGQLIGWVGDSGNAEATVPHLHFELRRANGTPVDPLPSLKAALTRGRELVPQPAPRLERPRRRGEPEERDDRDGLWRHLMGTPEEEPLVVPAPPMPPTEGQPRGGEVPEADPAVGRYPQLGMDRPVEVVEVEEVEEPAARRRGGWLGCLGFAPREREDEEAAAGEADG
jgi:hypothetical protein